MNEINTVKVKEAKKVFCINCNVIVEKYCKKCDGKKGYKILWREQNEKDN